MDFRRYKNIYSYGPEMVNVCLGMDLECLSGLLSVASPLTSTLYTDLYTTLVFVVLSVQSAARMATTVVHLVVSC